MKAQETLSLKTSRQWAMSSQHLHQPVKTRAELLNVIEHLGYVQMDAIYVIERAHHHILWNRCPAYQPDWLNQMMQDRQIFEYWGHAASYLPMCDYRYYQPLMQNFIQRSKWAQARYRAHGHLIPEILKRIDAEGPVSTRDFESAKKGTSGWWNWKPAKIALELMYWQGQIMVSHRQGFDKIYDLSERILPADLAKHPPDVDQLADFCLHTALRAHGLMSFRQICKHLPLSPKAKLNEALQRGIESNKVVSLQIEGLNEGYYALTESLANLKTIKIKGFQLLSPFDNLVIQRQRLQDLWGGNYLFEAYVPVEKRRYGYFSLLLFDGTDLVAFVDCKAHRQQSTLEVKKISYVKSLSQSRQKALQHYFLDFAQLNSCQSVDA